MGGWVGVARSSGNKTNSAFNWVEVEVEAELGNMFHFEVLVIYCGEEESCSSCTVIEQS